MWAEMCGLMKFWIIITPHCTPVLYPSRPGKRGEEVLMKSDVAFLLAIGEKLIDKPAHSARLYASDPEAERDYSNTFYSIYTKYIYATEKRLIPRGRAGHRYQLLRL